MISAKDACKATHDVRSEILEGIKNKIEREITMNIKMGGFSAFTEFDTFIDAAQQDELEEFLRGFGFFVDHIDGHKVKFSWLVD